MSVEENQTQPEEAEERRSVLSRRTLLRVGWTAPVILSVAPAVAFAASGTTGPPTTTQSVGGTTTHQSPGTTTTVPGGTSTAANNPPTTPGPVSGTGTGVPEQQSGGPQPARINRGFTG
jgi:hypothetical protein